MILQHWETRSLLSLYQSKYGITISVGTRGFLPSPPPPHTWRGSWDQGGGGGGRADAFRKTLQKTRFPKRRWAQTSCSPSPSLSSGVSPASTDIFSKGSKINHHPPRSYTACELQTSLQRVAEKSPRHRCSDRLAPQPTKF